MGWGHLPVLRPDLHTHWLTDHSAVGVLILLMRKPSQRGAPGEADLVGLCSSLFKDRVTPPLSHPQEAIEIPGKKNGCYGHMRGLLIQPPPQCRPGISLVLLGGTMNSS